MEALAAEETDTADGAGRRLRAPTPEVADDDLSPLQQRPGVTCQQVQTKGHGQKDAAARLQPMVDEGP